MYIFYSLGAFNTGHCIQYLVYVNNYLRGLNNTDIVNFVWLVFTMTVYPLGP